MNQVDTTYRTEFRDLFEVHFGRFDARMEQRVVQLEARFDQRVTRLEGWLDQGIAQLDGTLELPLLDRHARHGGGAA